MGMAERRKGQDQRDGKQVHAASQRGWRPRRALVRLNGAGGDGGTPWCACNVRSLGLEPNGKTPSAENSLSASFRTDHEQRPTCCAMESLEALLARARLPHLLPVLQEEELTPALLASMRVSLLAEALAEIGLCDADASALSQALHGDAAGLPPTASASPPLVLESTSQALHGEAAGLPPTAPASPPLVPESTSGSRVTSTQVAAACASAPTLLPPPARAAAGSAERLREIFEEELATSSHPNEAAAKALVRGRAEVKAATASAVRAAPASDPRVPVGRLAAAAEAGRLLAAAARVEDERLILEQMEHAKAAESKKTAVALEARKRRADALANHIEPTVRTKPPPPAAEAAADAASAAARAAAKLAAATPPTVAARARSTAERAKGRMHARAAADDRTADERLERVRALASERKARGEEKALLLAEAKADRAHRRVRRPFAVAPAAPDPDPERTTDAEPWERADSEVRTEDYVLP